MKIVLISAVLMLFFVPPTQTSIPRKSAEGDPKSGAFSSAPYGIAKKSPPKATRGAGKVILVLRTRDLQITVFGGGTESLYTIKTETGSLLAKRINGAALKVHFPELHDVVHGVAWAGPSR